MFESCLRNSEARIFFGLLFFAVPELFTCSQSQFFQGLLTFLTSHLLLLTSKLKQAKIE